jgi:sugar fermentation stimulation protein A
MHMKGGIESPAKGTYILLIEIPRGVCMKVGALGTLEFPRGFYAYCGSAMGGLGARINRHLRKQKKIWWHIDYLLQKGRVRGVMSAVTNERLECQLADGLGHAFNNYPGFGSSDCHCQSHLFFSVELLALQEKAAEVFKGLLKGGELIIEEC